MIVQLTVGYVAGFIAAAIFAARLWSPNVLTFILSGVLRDSNSAATWTVASTALQRSHWPWVLQSDSARNHGVRKDILALTWIISFMSFIIAIAGVVTPLGLHETLVSDKNTETPFKYLKDTSPFGFGTPPRSDLPLNRRCGGDFSPIPCPFTDSIAITTTNGTSTNFNYPYGYNIFLPESLRDIYTSGTSVDSSISSYFDIEWRRYQTTYDMNGLFNNGSNYLVGSTRTMQSMILNDAIEPVEGLLVDSKSGGIGFRNHTVPPGFQYGVSWQEDLLFIEPETVCVNTNTTIDYGISLNANSSVTIVNLALTDRGGFSELEQEYPLINLYNPQPNPKLHERAYKAAWMTNVYTMMFYNITSPTNTSGKTKAFSYLNSEVGKSFYLKDQGSSGNYDSLSLSYDFDSHLDVSGTLVFSSSNKSTLPRPTNPFSIQSSNFSDISLICSGAGSGDFANITNIYVGCGLMRGIPQRVDSGSSIIFDAGSKWSQPIYTCASAVKATIKTVHFTYNGTSELKNLVVSKVEPKIYASNSSKPLWGVEDSGNKYNQAEIELIWGIMSDKYENYPNVSSVRQESLYLPGYANKFGDSLEGIASQNLPASDFYPGAMGSTYSVGGFTYSRAVQADYTGQSSMAMWAQWQKLSRNDTTAYKIPNLVFTDYAAAAVVGTKGILGPGNKAQKNVVPLPVTPTISRIRYRMAFAIPALIAVLGLVLMTVAAFVTMIFHKHNIHKMQLQLQKLSPGRIFTTFLHPEMGGMRVSSKDWSRNTANVVVDISADYPFDGNALVGGKGTGGEKVAGRYERSVSDGSTERDQFLGTSGLPQPYVGIENAPASPVPGAPRY